MKLKNNLTLVTTLAGLISASIYFSSCDRGDGLESKNKKKIEFDMGGEIIQGGPNNLVIDENNPRNSYSRVDSILIYGYGLSYKMPDSLRDCNLKIILSGKMRETESVTGNIAVALHGRDSIYFWGSLKASAYITQPNSWVQFKDSVIIEKIVNKTSSEDLRFFSTKPIGKGFFDVDDLKIEIIKE